MADEQTGNGNGNGQPEEVPLLTAEQRASMDVQREIRTLTTQVLLDRMQWMRQAGITFDGKRDEYAIFGYDRIVTNQQYRDE